MRIENVAIGVIVFSLFIIIGSTFFLEMVNNYAVPADTSIFENITTDSDASGFDSTFRGATDAPEISGEDTESAIYKKGYSGTQKIWTATSIFGKTMERITSDTNGLIMPEVKNAFIWIVGVLIAAFVLYMIVRFKPQRD